MVQAVAALTMAPNNACAVRGSTDSGGLAHYFFLPIAAPPQRKARRTDLDLFIEKTGSKNRLKKLFLPNRSVAVVLYACSAMNK